jgi:hypothetical protein
MTSQFSLPPLVPQLEQAPYREKRQRIEDYRRF